MTRFKLDPENLVVVSFAPSASNWPGDDGLHDPEPVYSARNTCPEGNCAPYTLGGQWQYTCWAC